MRIGILTTTKDGIGGVERFTTYLERGFTERGHEVVVIDRTAISLVARAMVALSRFGGMQPVVMGYFLGWQTISSGCDVVVTNGLLGWNIAPRDRQKIINVQHGTYARSAERIDRGRNWIKYVIKRFVWGFFEGCAAKNANVCVAVSAETAESIRTYYRPDGVVVIQNAVDTEFFKPLPNVVKKKQAIFVGRFEYAKGQVILEEVERYLQSIGWQLVVAQNLSQDELRIAYNESQVFLLPSLHEGCSYALLDAMACGVPFLASPVGLVTDFKARGDFASCVVTDQTGTAYIRAFEKLVSMDDLAQQALRDELRDYVVRNHGIVSAMEQYVALVK